MAPDVRAPGAVAAVPFDVLSDRLVPYGLRVHGDRGRAICPVCGGRNRSTLSVGVTPDGAVLMKCFKSGCSVDQITAALGLQVSDLFPPRPAAPGGGAPALKRRRLLTDRQALELLDDEAAIVFVVACDIGAGREINEQDRQRVLTAAARIAMLRTEVMQ